MAEESFSVHRIVNSHRREILPSFLKSCCGFVFVLQWILSNCHWVLARTVQSTSRHIPLSPCVWGQGLVCKGIIKEYNQTVSFLSQPMMNWQIFSSTDLCVHFPISISNWRKRSLKAHWIQTEPFLNVKQIAWKFFTVRCKWWKTE